MQCKTLWVCGSAAAPPLLCMHTRANTHPNALVLLRTSHSCFNPKLVASAQTSSRLTFRDPYLDPSLIHIGQYLILTSLYVCFFANSNYYIIFIIVIIIIYKVTQSCGQPGTARKRAKREICLKFVLASHRWQRQMFGFQIQFMNLNCKNHKKQIHTLSKSLSNKLKTTVLDLKWTLGCVMISMATSCLAFHCFENKMSLIMCWVIQRLSPLLCYQSALVIWYSLREWPKIWIDDVDLPCLKKLHQYWTWCQYWIGRSHL